MDAFEMEVWGCRKKLYTFGNKYFKKVFDPTDMDDLVQEAILGALTNRASFQGKSTIATWVIAIFRFKALTKLRGAKNVASIDDMLDGVGDTALPTVLHLQPVYDDELDKQRIVDLLREEIALLSESHREVVHYIYYQDLTVEETAAKIGIPANTVKTRMFYARKQLREQLADCRNMF